MIFYFQTAAAIVLSIIVMATAFKFAGKRFSRSASSLVPPSIKRPLVIHLQDDPNPDWVKLKAPRKSIQDLKRLGFIVGRPYQIAEMDGVRLLSLFNNDFIAIVYHDANSGCWTEVGYQSENRSLFLVSNSPVTQEIKTHPKTKKIYKAGAVPKDLLNILKQEVENVWASRITNDNFSRTYERYYRRDICWRNNEGGITIQEFKKKLKDANTEFNITKEDLRRVFLETKVDELFQWHDACLAEYKKATEQKDEDFREIEDKLLIVPNRTISQAFIEYLVNVEFIQHAATEKLVNAFRKNTNIPMIFDLINSNSAEGQAKKIWNVEYPLDAQIFYRGDSA